MDKAECGSALYGAETWKTTQSVDLLYMEQKPEGKCRVWVCFIWIRNLKDNAECGSALYVTGRMEIGKREDNLEDSKKSVSALYVRQHEHVM